jgi:Ulp1 family protease
VIRSPCNANESVLTTKNDPDYLRLSQTRFEINKSYMELIQKCLGSNKESDEVVIKNDVLGYSLVRGSLERLRPGRWFNDEIINGYVNLVNSNQGRRVFAVNTFFFTMLEDMIGRNEYSFNKLQRVMKRLKFSLDRYDTLLIPVNVR